MSPVTVVVDGDSCPRAVREILQRSAARGRILLELYRSASLPSAGDSFIAVAGDVDERIVERTTELRTRRVACVVITRDIPLAERLIERGVDVLNDRGTTFDRDSIRVRRSIRDAAASIRRAGLETMQRGTGFSSASRTAFANALDRYLTRIETGGG